MIEAVGGKASEVRLLEVRVRQAAAEGRMADSRELRLRAVDAARRQGLPELGAEITARSALWEALLGDPEAAQELATASLESIRSRETLRLSALALALTGAEEEARSHLDELYERFPQNTRVLELYGPTIEAALALESGDAAAAGRGLERAAPYDSDSLVTLYLRARAHHETGNQELALEELEQILDRPGVAPTSPLRTLAHLAAARAYAAQSDSVAASDAYRAFLARTQAADEEWELRQAALREVESVRETAEPTS